MSNAPSTLKQIAAELAKTLSCNCDLDNWEPERSTGHSHVCRIHKRAIEQFANARALLAQATNSETAP